VEWEGGKVQYQNVAEMSDRNRQGILYSHEPRPKRLKEKDAERHLNSFVNAIMIFFSVQSLTNRLSELRPISQIEQGHCHCRSIRLRVVFGPFT
jgi:hypothetical protein